MFITDLKKKIIVCMEYQGRGRPYTIDPDRMIKTEYEPQSNERYIWDYLRCFKPPADVSFAFNKLFKVEELDAKSFEYRYVAYKFGKTFKARDELTLSIKRTVKGLMREGLPPEANCISKIQKIYNYIVYDRVE